MKTPLSRFDARVFLQNRPASGRCQWIAGWRRCVEVSQVMISATSPRTAPLLRRPACPLCGCFWGQALVGSYPHWRGYLAKMNTYMCKDSNELYNQAAEISSARKRPTEYIRDSLSPAGNCVNLTQLDSPITHLFSLRGWTCEAWLRFIFTYIPAESTFTNIMWLFRLGSIVRRERIERRFPPPKKSREVMEGGHDPNESLSAS